MIAGLSNRFVNLVDKVYKLVTRLIILINQCEEVIHSLNHVQKLKGTVNNTPFHAPKRQTEASPGFLQLCYSVKLGQVILIDSVMVAVAHAIF